MDQEKHLRPEIVFGYRSGLLLPSELREMDAHVSACESCRHRLAVAVDTDVAGAATALRAILEQKEPPNGGRNFAWYAIAAGLVIAIGAGTWFSVVRHPMQSSLGSSNTAPDGAVLFEQQRKVAAALQSGRIELPAFLGDLRSKQEVLLGSAAPVRMNLTSPAGTAVATPRPEFQWTSLGKKTGEKWIYKVRIFAPGFQVAAESPDLTTNTWTAEADLAAGVNFEWQVTAVRGEQRLTFPQPPLTPPKFRVLDAATIARIQKLAAQPGVSPLILAIAYAEAGSMEQSRHKFEETILDQPGRPEVQKLLDSLDAP